MPYNFVYAGVFICSSKCRHSLLLLGAKWGTHRCILVTGYFGAILATLNARDGLRERHRIRSSPAPEKLTIARVLKSEHEYAAEEVKENQNILICETSHISSMNQKAGDHVLKTLSWLEAQSHTVGQAV